MALQTNLLHKDTQCKHTTPKATNQARQTIEKDWFNILNFL
jgi:hypothetical protein